jgi:hypothetical protein
LKKYSTRLKSSMSLARPALISLAAWKTKNIFVRAKEHNGKGYGPRAVRRCPQR